MIRVRGTAFMSGVVVKVVDRSRSWRDRMRSASSRG